MFIIANNIYYHKSLALRNHYGKNSLTLPEKGQAAPQPTTLHRNVSQRMEKKMHRMFFFAKKVP